MGFSIFVEMLNLRVAKKTAAEPVVLRGRGTGEAEEPTGG
jgi:hypothetical protein